MDLTFPPLGSCTLSSALHPWPPGLPCRQISTGLDSATTHDICKSLRQACHILRVRCACLVAARTRACLSQRTKQPE